MRLFTHVLGAALCLLIGASAFADGDPETGKLRAQTCLGCHGAPGMRNAYPGYRVPKLGGQHEFYIVSALKSYKEGRRPHPTMQAQAAGLSEEDMEHIAAYFASLADPQSEPTGIPDDNPATACVACHQKDGVSPADPDAAQGAPILAGQYPEYLVQVLTEYKSGERENAIMNGLAAALSRSQMEAIAEFYYDQEGLAAPHIGD